MENEKIRVLLVDDDQGDFEMIRVMLANAETQEYKLDWVSNFEEALDAFEAAEHDVYFLDYFLEDRTGLDLLREARARGIEAPIIMLTGRGSRKVDMEAMELGASDYLVKGLIDPDAMERAIRHATERAQGNQALKALRERGPGLPTSRTSERSDVGAEFAAARFWAVFDSTRTGIALVGLDGVLLEVNPAFSRIFPADLRWEDGPSYLDLLEEGDREAVSKEMKALAAGETAKFEAARRFLVREGDVGWGHTTMTLVADLEGTPDHLVVVLDRVSEGE